MNRLHLLFVAAWSVFHIAAAGAVDIETVSVGNPGNRPDTRFDGLAIGAVNYAYNIGRFEVTAGQYCAFLNAVAKTDPYGLYNTRMLTGPRGCQITRIGVSGEYSYDFSGRASGEESDWVNRPVNYVSWGDAARFANWLHWSQPSGPQARILIESGAYNLYGKTSYSELMTVTRNANAKWWIPDRDEWYKAAYHDKTAGLAAVYFDYPTGTNAVPSNVLSNPSPDPGNNANFRVFNSDYTLGDPYWTTAVGDFENSESPYGTFDQGGNLWEWTERSKNNGRELRGGALITHASSLLASYDTYYAVASEESSSVGLRVASVAGVPEPSTFVLLGICAVGLLAFGSRRRKACRPRTVVGRESEISDFRSEI